MASSTVLVVDDNPASLETTTLILREEGYEVLAADTGEEALRLIRERRPELALLDVAMPELGGLEVVRRVRGDPGLESVMLVLLNSLGTTPEDQAEGLDEGADGFIARPIANRELLARVRAFLRQRELQERLRASEARFRELIQGQPDAVLVVDREGSIRFANPAAADLLGRPVEALEGAPFGFPLGDGTRTEVQLRGPKGETRIAEMHVGTTLWDNESCWLTTLRDVTFRRTAEERLREQATLLEKAHDAILALDMDGVIIFWNPGAERTYGWSAERAVGRSAAELLHPDSKVPSEVERELMERGEWTGELEHQRQDGSHITVEASWTLISDEDGEPSRILGIHSDVTEKKKVMQQFLRAQRLESIGTLAGGIAHDLNNVLAPILLSIGLLKLDVHDEEMLDTLSTIESSARRGTDMVRQVLAYSKGAEGLRKPVDLNGIVEELERVVHEAFPKNIRLRHEVPGDLWAVLGDRTQVHQILMNLAVNARDAMPEGGDLRLEAENVEIDEQYVSVRRQGEPGPYVRIRVEDSGTGIPSGIRDQVFDPFFTTKDPGEGTGLGLFSVAAIVRSHKGFVDLWSEPGRGTVVTIWLPASPEQEATEGSSGKELPRGRGDTILVVDDDPAVRAITRKTLEAFDYRVRTASDGAEAVAEYAQWGSEIALVLTDITMPIMDGPSAIQALRRIDPSVRVVATSGRGSAPGFEAEDGPGAMPFLPKPFTARALLTLLHRVLYENG